MTDPKARPAVDRTTLFRTGLIVVGLLVGILLTLWLVPHTNEFQRPLTVERVELGSSAPAALNNVPVTDAPDALFDAMSLNEAFKYVAARVTPSVVFIEVSGPSERSMFNLRRRMGGFVPRSVGSGVIISEQGFVVTNNHVIDGAEEIHVTLQDKRQYTAQVIGTDADTDVAVLKLNNSTELPSISLGKSSDLAVGEWVIAVGNPFRLTSTVTAGIVSALGRSVDVIDNAFGIEDFIQTDAAINPGNSGGALVNLRGELVGISTAIATETGSYEGYGFAVPVDLMERVVADLIQYGNVHRGYLGVSIQALDSDQAKDLGLEDVRGVLLSNVYDGLAGDLAGLRTGDVLLSIDGHAVSEPNELQSAIAMHRAGEAFSVVVWRNGRERSFEVTLVGRDNPRYQDWLTDLEEERTGGQAPPGLIPDLPEAEVQRLDAWGVGLARLDGRLQGRFNVPHGAYIAYVESDSPFGRAEVPRDVLLTSIDDVQVFTLESAMSRLEALLQASESVVLEVMRPDGVKLFFEVEVPHE
jgi:Do/DeqQ family serine protease